MSTAERRLNLLTGDWVLVSPQRLARPWRGEETSPAPERSPRYDPDCPLCPGNARAGGATNPAYDGVFVFDNDFPALTAAAAPEVRPHDPLLVAAPESGVCRVVCYSPDHGLALAQCRPPRSARLSTSGPRSRRSSRSVPTSPR